LVGRKVEGGGKTEQECDYPDVPKSEMACQGQGAHQDSEQGHRPLRNHKNPAPLHPVSRDSAERHQNQGWD